MAEEETKSFLKKTVTPAPVVEPTPAAPTVPVEVKKTVTVDASVLAGADTNGDGHVSSEEMDMYLEFKRKELEDADARRDAMRQMTWFALFGMLLYPFSIALTTLFGLDKAATIIGSIAPTYFVAISALVAAYFGANAYSDKKTSSDTKKPIKK